MQAGVAIWYDQSASNGELASLDYHEEGAASTSCCVILPRLLCLKDSPLDRTSAQPIKHPGSAPSRVLAA